MTTQHADQTTHTGSLWTATLDLPECPSLTEDLRVDVCIVGAGVVGITTAYVLARAGKAVAVVDDGPLAHGTTAMTTAHLTCVLDERFYDLERMHGEEGARLAAESHMTAINRIETIVASERIDCDFERLNGYLFLSPDDDEETLVRELAAAQRAGIDVALLSRAPMPSLETGQCLLFPDQAQVHPYKYLAGLVRAIQRDGGRVYTNTHADRIEGGDVPQVAARGHVIRADAVIVSTLAPVNDLVAINPKQAPQMSYVIGARVPHGAVRRALYWETGFPYHYVRVQSDPDVDGEFLIVGGEDHRTGQDDDTAVHQARLERWARDRFPAIEDIDYVWAGQVMQSADGLAFIGRHPSDSANIYVVTGDSGTGMTYAMIAGIMITDLVEGRDNPWTTLYTPSRRTLRTAPAYARDAVRTASEYADGFMPGEARTAGDVPPDGGAVVREGVMPLAIYREPDGTLHRMSAVCVHLGCIVRWNAAERTWDCPCHGSRYDRFGVVLTGPANRDLRRR